MSFHYEVMGLVKNAAKSSLVDQYAVITGLTRSSTYTCLDFYGDLYTCYGADDGTTDVSISLASTGYDATADYYYVSARIDGPTTIAPGGCHEQTSPTDGPPCGAVGADIPVYDGTVAPGAWTRLVGSTGSGSTGSAQETVPDDFTAIGTTESNWRAATFWPDRTAVPGTSRGIGAYLVNPSPPWPVPDAAGNTFGNCLFTAAQLPATVDLSLIHHNREEITAGKLWLYVQAYDIGEPPVPEEGVHGVYVHGA